MSAGGDRPFPLYLARVVLCVAIGLVFARAFVFQQNWIVSGSMEPLLARGDLLLVDRWRYVPRTTRVERQLLGPATIRHGDVVTFRHPHRPEMIYIKRVVGLPGDWIEIRAGRLYRNGRSFAEPWVQQPHEARGQNFRPQRVPDDHLFVLGDRRHDSADSEEWGALPIGLVQGRAIFVWWSWAEGAPDWRPPDDPGRIDGYAPGRRWLRTVR